MKNHSVKLFELRHVFRRRSSITDFLSGALAALVLSGVEPYMQFWLKHYWEHSSEVILNLDLWSRRSFP